MQSAALLHVLSPWLWVSAPPTFLQVWVNVSLTPCLLEFHEVSFSGTSGCLLFLDWLLSFFWLCKEVKCFYLCLHLGCNSDCTSWRWQITQAWAFGGHLFSSVDFIVFYDWLFNFLFLFPSTQACALNENWTGDPLVCRPALNPVSYWTDFKWSRKKEVALGQMCYMCFFSLQHICLCPKHQWRHLVHAKGPWNLVPSKTFTLRKCPWFQIAHSIFFHLWFAWLML